MMKKGLATRTTILMILGLLVLTVMVYIFLRVTGNPELSCTECRSRFIAWCTKCGLTNGDKASWDVPGWPMDSELIECTHRCGFHQRFEVATDQNSISNCNDAKTAGRLKEDDPCITCVAENVQWHCYEVGAAPKP